MADAINSLEMLVKQQGARRTHWGMNADWVRGYRVRRGRRARVFPRLPEDGYRFFGGVAGGTFASWVPWPNNYIAMPGWGKWVSCGFPAPPLPRVGGDDVNEQQNIEYQYSNGKPKFPISTSQLFNVEYSVSVSWILLRRV